ncbi:hypothetical protein CHL67_02195 [Prosthecochloris sp. GSB1]|uniref:electron transfer flavoprotein subunit beta/FixA family protein n=1 Tax=Prosthecochloris sp. GSB1 TaxID=281093 RepID=UPI000B8CA07C|nr:electron transfer flavoprotein subunit beta/FixA family protein [Prosthecochloris sp. GSB1]ASQ89886.1 hypothetical protein CHL67_02195 [Prosthecochloris sp. GSB1]
MEITVCINQVPDTGSAIVVRDGVVDATRLNMVMNPYDEYAVEEALRFRERFAESRVTVFSVGGEDRFGILRKAIAMGADGACLAESGGVVGDSFSTASILCEAIKRYYARKPDIVICGRESVDCNRAEVPLMVAEMLGMASLSAVVSLKAHEGYLEAKREVEGGVEEYVLETPAVISVEKGLNTPRKTNIKAVMQARKKTIDRMDGFALVEPKVLYRELAAVQRKRTCRFVDSVEELTRLLHQTTGFLK